MSRKLHCHAKTTGRIVVVLHNSDDDLIDREAPVRCEVCAAGPRQNKCDGGTKACPATRILPECYSNAAYLAREIPGEPGQQASGYSCTTAEWRRRR